MLTIKKQMTVMIDYEGVSRVGLRSLAALGAPQFWGTFSKSTHHIFVVATVPMVLYVLSK